MKLYQFDYFKGDKNPITMTERDAVEKPKIYEFEGAFGKRRIAKESINKIFSDYGSTVFLLEPNYEKAKEIFLNALKTKIDAKRKALLSLEKDCQILAKLSFSSKTESLMTEEMQEELKTSLFMEGIEVIEEFLNMEVPSFLEKDSIDNIMNTALLNMPQEEALGWYQKYCKPATLERRGNFYEII